MSRARQILPGKTYIIDRRCILLLTQIVTELQFNMVAKQKHRPTKHDNLQKLVLIHVDSGRYLDTRHAFERKHERMITLAEILYVLRHGYHEKRKDKFKPEYNAWNYAIRGETVDKRDLRVCISFDENDMLIITAIEIVGRT